MPEQITKYPDVTLKVLKDAGARCAEGVKQEVLKKCPPENFCKLPTGELCIYGIEEIPNMTQITVADLAPIVCKPPSPVTALDGVDVAVLGALGAGLLAWRAVRR